MVSRGRGELLFRTRYTCSENVMRSRLKIRHLAWGYCEWSEVNVGFLVKTTLTQRESLGFPLGWGNQSCVLRLNLNFLEI